MVQIQTNIGYAKYATRTAAEQVADSLPGVSGSHSHAGKDGISTPNIGDRYFEPGVRKDHKNLDAALVEMGMKPTIAPPGGNRNVTNEHGNLDPQKLGLSPDAKREELDLPTFFGGMKDGSMTDVSDGGDPEDTTDLLDLDESSPGTGVFDLDGGSGDDDDDDLKIL
jgi:hypothetical protein